MPIIRADDTSFTEVLQLAVPPLYRADWKYLGTTRTLPSGVLNHYFSVPPEGPHPAYIAVAIAEEGAELSSPRFLIEPDALRRRSRALTALVNRHFPQPKPFWSNKW